MNFVGERFALDYHHQFLTAEESQNLFALIEMRVVWSRTITPGRRVRQDFGDDGVSYSFSIRGKTITRKVRPWAEFPALLLVKERLETLTGAKFTYCVIQRYPSGNVGIDPHRDKEMNPETIIAGVSLGSTRKLVMGPPYYNSTHVTPFWIDLAPGSLYLIRPPTNDHWSHSILKDSTINEPRISLTFRQQ